MPVIGILSGKGGVGKTTIVANIGTCLAKDFGVKPLIIDSSIATSHLGLHFGIYENPPVTLRDVLTKGMHYMNSVYLEPKTGLRLLPAPLDGGKVKLSRLNDVVQKAKKDYPYVIVDFAPGLGKEIISVLKNIDYAIVIANPDFASVGDAAKTCKLLKKMNKPIMGIVLNRVRNHNYELTSAEVESVCNITIIAKIPEDESVPKSISMGMPVVAYMQHAPATLAIKNLCAHMIGKESEGGSVFDRFKFVYEMLMQKNKSKLSFVRETGEVEEESVQANSHQQEYGDAAPAQAERKDIEMLSQSLKEELKKELKEEVMKRLKAKGSRL